MRSWRTVFSFPLLILRNVLLVALINGCSVSKGRRRELLDFLPHSHRICSRAASTTSYVASYALTIPGHHLHFIQPGRCTFKKKDEQEEEGEKVKPLEREEALKNEPERDTTDRHIPRRSTDSERKEKERGTGSLLEHSFMMGTFNFLSWWVTINLRMNKFWSVFQNSGSKLEAELTERQWLDGEPRSYRGDSVSMNVRLALDWQILSSRNSVLSSFLLTCPKVTHFV